MRRAAYSDVEFPRMLLQVEIPAEAFSAYIASKRFPLVVCMHVEGQVVDLVECLVAYRTFVSFLSAVGQTMVLIVAFLVEAFAAELADEGLIPCVDSGVRVECGRSVERFPTCQALVRLLRRVDDLMTA